MSGEIDEAVKRLERRAQLLDGQTLRDIRIVLDGLSEARSRSDLFEGRWSAAREVILMAEQERDGALAVIERAKSWNTHDTDEPQFWDLQHVLNTAPVDALRERDAALLERLAGEIHATLTDPDRVRPRLTSAEVSTDYANDIEWAVQIVLAKANELRKEQS